MEPWKALAQEDYEVHYIVLRASKKETMKRAVERSKLDRKTNIELVETMWEQFSGLGVYESNVIDTTTFTIKDTVSAIKATAEHPVYTSRGWIRVCDLREGDEIAKIGR